MYIPVSLTSTWNKGEKTVEVKALLDCGAGDMFIDKGFVHKHRLPILPLKKPMGVFNVDRTPNKEERITHFTQLKTWINRRMKKTLFLVAGLGKEDVILGFPWLQTKAPIIDWEQGTLQWKEAPNANEEKEKKEITEEMEKESKSIWIQAKTTASQQITQKHEEKKKKLPLKEQIPREYHEFLERFNKETASRFPGPRTWDHRIDLKPNFIPKRGKIYSLFRKEENELNKFLKEGDQWKAAFVTNKGLFEPTVMFFRLTNSPATFQAMMDSILEEEVRAGEVIIYMTTS
jgi:hypothetical protein